MLLIMLLESEFGLMRPTYHEVFRDNMKTSSIETATTQEALEAEDFLVHWTKFHIVDVQRSSLHDSMEQL